MRAAGSATGVRVAKWLGDGAMLVSVDTASLVMAIHRIMRAVRDSDIELPLSAGVSDGNVILFEGDDHIGSAVNLAARLADIAQPGQILARSDLFPGVNRTKAVVGPVEIAGFDGPIEVADLARCRPWSKPQPLTAFPLIGYQIDTLSNQQCKPTGTRCPSRSPNSASSPSWPVP
ncbi:MAG: hypothetical protein R2710_14945 [Acidimicrobiales bacterium]